MSHGGVCALKHEEVGTHTVIPRGDAVQLGRASTCGNPRERQPSRTGKNADRSAIRCPVLAKKYIMGLKCSNVSLSML